MFLSHLKRRPVSLESFSASPESSLHSKDPKVFIAFITFCGKEAAQEAVKLCDSYEIRPGKHLGVCISVANNRLFCWISSEE